MVARIYKPAKTAMQSGQAKTKFWRLEYAPESPRVVEPLMGWTSSRDMKSQIKLNFESKEQAIAYCQKRGIPFQVIEPKERKFHKRAYGDNFRHDRVETWTH